MADDVNKLVDAIKNIDTDKIPTDGHLSEARRMLDRIAKDVDDDDMTEWEVEFVGDVEVYERQGGLSEKQMNCLRQIYRKYC